jgi:hypothetical protein
VTAPRRGRGRPALFDTAARARYLDALTAGATKKDAAAAAGVAPKTARDARTDTRWRAAEDDAYARGKAARLDRLPHGASRYVHHDCRCPICTKAASAARAGCLDRAPKEATIVPITPPDQGSPKTFPLADAS